MTQSISDFKIDSRLTREVARRRTFAIISHPDAGKTTLTEKLLLYGGAIQLAGSVTARKQQRATTSDWMELEKQRGISISSTVLQFEYQTHVVNLLDTPGHKDFSEDTYRVLTAVDSVIMVIDAAKGIESQTKKLFEVCRLRHIPIFTFINKLDRPGRNPLQLLDELENTLGLQAFPVNWPLGMGSSFKGVFDRMSRQVSLFEKTVHNQHAAPVQVTGIDDPIVASKVDAQDYAQAREELEMLEIAGAEFNLDRVRSGETTPIFFGSALTNFGVQHLLDFYVKHGNPPAARRSGDRDVPPDCQEFSGFVFKIQANMDPKHRDRIAFVRICSGKFEKDMTAFATGSSKPVRLSYSQRLFGRERETVEVAYAGDIVGLVGNASLKIGDTIATDRTITYEELPTFEPEVFSMLHNPSLGKFKQFRQGLDQLREEGVIQIFHLLEGGQRLASPLLGAVGQLQFEVFQYRLREEYGAESRLEPAAFQLVRWVGNGTTKEDLRNIYMGSGVRVGEDSRGNLVMFFPNQWSLEYFVKENPKIVLGARP